MRPLLEHPPRSSSTSWHTHVRAEPRFPFSWHHHREHELTLVRRGRGRRFVGDSSEDYGPGDLVLLGPDLPHTWQSAEVPVTPHEALVVQLQADFLGPELPRRPELATIGRLFDTAGPGLHFPREVAEHVEALTTGWVDASPATRTVTLLSVLVTLGAARDDGRARTLASATFHPVLRLDQRERLERVCLLVAEHYDEPLSLVAAARVAGMAPAAFSRLFSRGMGRSFTQHVLAVRLTAAQQRLQHTDDAVATIAFRCGFANLANFNRRFRAALGTTPSAYRRAALATGVGALGAS